MTTRANVNLWGRQIGAVIWDPNRDLGVLEYEPRFAQSGIEVAPLTMPLRTNTFDFPTLPRGTCMVCPGFLLTVYRIASETRSSTDGLPSRGDRLTAWIRLSVSYIRGDAVWER